MIKNPDASVRWYLDAGADILTVHVEAATHLNRIVASIHEAGALAGVSLNPGTPVSALEGIIELVDLVLVMSVNPGFGGQRFIPGSTTRIAQIAALAREKGVAPRIEVDGGIDAETAPLVTSAGADTLVAGSAIFCAPDPAAAIAEIRGSAAGRMV
jgi:ribulose-phosphate 3-epimerase